MSVCSIGYVLSCQDAKKGGEMAALSFNNERARYRRRRWIGVFLSTAMLSTSSGCSILPGLQQSLDYSDECNEAMLGYRNQASAAKAWLCRKHCYKDRCDLDDFGAGFRAGYMEIASGGSGCTPAFAPREYWSWKYQSGSGQKRVSSWFAGFPLGAQAAEEDGIGNYAFVGASSEMRATYNNGGYANAPGGFGPGAVDPALTAGGYDLAPTPIGSKQEDSEKSSAKSGKSSKTKRDSGTVPKSTTPRSSDDGSAEDLSPVNRTPPPTPEGREPGGLRDPTSDAIANPFKQ